MLATIAAADFLMGVGVNLAMKSVEDASLSVGGILFKSIIGRLPYVGASAWGRLGGKLGQTEADKLRGLIGKKRQLAGRVSCAGAFMPGSLLAFGWWERSDRSLNEKDWRDIAGIQRWLFNGFEQWAPSWDTNLWDDNSDS